MASNKNLDKNQPPSMPPPVYSPTLPPLYTECNIQLNQRALPSISDIVFCLISPFQASTGPAFDATTIPNTASLDASTEPFSPSPWASPSLMPNCWERQTHNQIVQDTLHEAQRELQHED